MSAAPREPLALVGMACMVPGAADYEAYWDRLADGAGPDAGAFADAESFDPARYGIGEHEARIMDPQNRRFLMLAEAAFADAGYARGQGMGRVGVIASQACNGTYHDYLTRLAAQGRIPALPTLLENVNRGSDFLATRVSYTFDLNGPAFNLQSGCSSSLVAIGEACHLLWSGRCDAVLAGGVTITYPLDGGYVYEAGSIYSAGGVCRPFDAAADGTVPGCGGGAVVLKRLDRALRDGDRIHALVRGAGANNDGARKVSFAAPSTDGQLAMLRDTYAEAGVAPGQLAFVECHATGTVMGDPIEVRALRRLVESYPPAQPFRPILLGSAKGHVGHLFWSSGVVSLIKAVLALKHARYPGTASLATPNPLLGLHDAPFAVSALATDLDLDARDCCGVSSMGVGGTNAHVVLQRYRGAAGTRAPLPRPDWQLRRFTLVPDDAGVSAVAAAAPVPARAAQLREAIVALYRDVLSEADVGDDSNYFDLYGDSITAVTMIAQLKAQFGVALTPEDIYDHPTPLALARHLEARLAAPAAAAPAAPAPEQTRLNRFQARFYLLEKMQRGTFSSYNVPLCLAGTAAPDWDRLTAALQAVLGRLPAFARALGWKGGVIELGAPRPRVLAAHRLDLPADADPAPRLDAFFGQRFALENGETARLLHLRHGARHYLALNFPHLLIDGTGLDNLLRAVERALAGEPVAPPQAVPEQPWSDEDVGFWQARLRGVAPTGLADDAAPDTGTPRYPAGVVDVDVPQALRSAAQALCRAGRCTPFVVYYAIFNALLARASGEAYVLTGTTLANRDAATLHQVDCRINNLPLHVAVPDPLDYQAILDATAAELGAAMRHAHVPLDVIAQAAGGGSPYRILFMFQNQNDGYRLRLDGNVWTEGPYRYQPVYGELCFQVRTDADGGMRLVVHYDPASHGHADVEHLVSRFFALGLDFTQTILRADTHA